MHHTTLYNSPFGCFELQASAKGLTGVRRMSDTACAKTSPASGVLEKTITQLEAYFDGQLQAFDLPLDWGDATAFNQAVWQELLRIPYGHTTTYSAIAEKLDNPKAVRAVGLANRNNPIAIIVPCHRVIAKNGDLQGYFYGLDMKRQLLELENPMSFARQGSLF